MLDSTDRGLQYGHAVLHVAHVILDRRNISADGSQVFNDEVVDVFHGFSLLLGSPTPNRQRWDEGVGRRRQQGTARGFIKKDSCWRLSRKR